MRSWDLIRQSVCTVLDVLTYSLQTPTEDLRIKDIPTAETDDKTRERRRKVGQQEPPGCRYTWQWLVEEDEPDLLPDNTNAMFRQMQHLPSPILCNYVYAASVLRQMAEINKGFGMYRALTIPREPKPSPPSKSRALYTFNPKRPGSSTFDSSEYRQGYGGKDNDDDEGNRSKNGRKQKLRKRKREAENEKEKETEGGPTDEDGDDGEDNVDGGDGGDNGAGNDDPEDDLDEPRRKRAKGAGGGESQRPATSATPGGRNATHEPPLGGIEGPGHGGWRKLSEDGVDTLMSFFALRRGGPEVERLMEEMEEEEEHRGYESISAWRRNVDDSSGL